MYWHWTLTVRYGTPWMVTTRPLQQLQQYLPAMPRQLMTLLQRLLWLVWHYSHYSILYLFPSVLWHCWLGDRKDIRPVKSRVLVCWWWWFDWSFARLIAPVVITTSITLSSNKLQNGDILVNPLPPGKWPVKTERLTIISVYRYRHANPSTFYLFILLFWS